MNEKLSLMSSEERWELADFLRRQDTTALWGKDRILRAYGLTEMRIAPVYIDEVRKIIYFEFENIIFYAPINYLLPGIDYLRKFIHQMDPKGETT